MKTKYMHSVDSRPASFSGEQICFATRTRPIKLVDSLRQIRQEQKTSVRWRTAQGFDTEHDYGHFRVLID